MHTLSTYPPPLSSPPMYYQPMLPPPQMGYVNPYAVIDNYMSKYTASQQGDGNYKNTLMNSNPDMNNWAYNNLQQNQWYSQPNYSSLAYPSYSPYMNNYSNMYNNDMRNGYMNNYMIGRWNQSVINAYNSYMKMLPSYMNAMMPYYNYYFWTNYMQHQVPIYSPTMNLNPGWPLIQNYQSTFMQQPSPQLLDSYYPPKTNNGDVLSSTVGRPFQSSANIIKDLTPSTKPNLLKEMNSENEYIIRVEQYDSSNFKSMDPSAQNDSVKISEKVSSLVSTEDLPPLLKPIRSSQVPLRALHNNGTQKELSMKKCNDFPCGWTKTDSWIKPSRSISESKSEVSRNIEHTRLHDTLSACKNEMNS